jgi:hypothetical protein
MEAESFWGGIQREGLNVVDILLLLTSNRTVVKATS